MNHILFPITYDCNLSCPGCCVVRGCNLDVDSCISNIRTRKGEVDWVFVTGGEPFMVPELFDICDEIRAEGFKVGVVTNGTIFKPEIADHVDRFGISLDGDEEYHDDYRGKGVFKKAVDFLEFVKEKDTCETVVMSVAFKGNEEALLRLKPLVDEIDPDYWQIQRDVLDESVVINPELTQ